MLAYKATPYKEGHCTYLQQKNRQSNASKQIMTNDLKCNAIKIAAARALTFDSLSSHYQTCQPMVAVRAKAGSS